MSDRQTGGAIARWGSLLVAVSLAMSIGAPSALAGDASPAVTAPTADAASSQPEASLADVWHLSAPLLTVSGGYSSFVIGSSKGGAANTLLARLDFNWVSLVAGFLFSDSVEVGVEFLRGRGFRLWESDRGWVGVGLLLPSIGLSGVIYFGYRDQWWAKTMVVGKFSPIGVRLAVANYFVLNLRPTLDAYVAPVAILAGNGGSGNKNNGGNNNGGNNNGSNNGGSNNNGSSFFPGITLGISVEIGFSTQADGPILSPEQKR